VCDALAVVGTDRTLFAKNSDRPVGEAQVVEAYPARPPGGRLRTQYLEIDDAGAHAAVGSRPTWLWGFEHGFNEHGVAVGNEKIWTTDNPRRAEPALIGMDLVRLGLERGATAAETLDVMTALLEEHGQGGVCEEATGDAYYSSFLIGDPGHAFVLETSGREWAAHEVTPAEGGAAISNRVVLPEFATHRHPAAPTGHADVRLAVTRPVAHRGIDRLSPADLTATMRDHGGATFPPATADPVTGEGVSVCMHVRGYQATAASMICDLGPSDRAAWAVLGNPCVSVYVPVAVGAVPDALASPATWLAFDTLRARVEADPARLDDVRAALDPIESDLWAHGPGGDLAPLLGALEDLARRLT